MQNISGICNCCSTFRCGGTNWFDLWEEMQVLLHLKSIFLSRIVDPKICFPADVLHIEVDHNLY